MVKKICLLFLTLVALIIAGCAVPGLKKPPTRPVQPAHPKIKKEAGTADRIIEALITGKISVVKIAVMDFTDLIGNDLQEGRLLAKELTKILSRNKTLTVIERKRIKSVISANKANLTGIVEDDSQMIGEKLKANAILSGMIIHLENIDIIKAFLIDLKTEKVIGTAEIRKPYEFTDISPISYSGRPMPGERRAAMTLRKELMLVRDKEPFIFRKAVAAIRNIEGIKLEEPRYFLLLDEPEGSKMFERLSVQHRALYERTMNLKSELAEVFRHVPSYRDVLEFERVRVLKNLKENAFGQ